MLLKVLFVSFPFFLQPILGSASDHLGTSFIHFNFKDFLEVISLANYNTRLVILSTSILGIASGSIGSFLLLRKRSLIGDAISHACLPGIGIAFLIMTALGNTGKFLPGLLLGASISGFVGVLVVMAIRNTTKLKDDAAMGIVLSIFFGLGVALLRIITEIPGASAAGLESFIYGKTASIVLYDFWLISLVAILVTVASFILLKEWTLLCFDSGYAATQGWPVYALDFSLLVGITLVTVIGLQSVGLILIIAFLIIPPSAARFWTENLKKMLIISSVLGGLSGWVGATMSALFQNLPAGAVIVLVATTIFIFSMLFGTSRGLLIRFIKHTKLNRKIGRDHLMHSSYEVLEEMAMHENRMINNQKIKRSRLLQRRSWMDTELKSLIHTSKKNGLIERYTDEYILLGEAGFAEAARTTRNHRLWEMYLIEYAEVAPTNVDRGADLVEHVLGADIVRMLESKMKTSPYMYIPNPHSESEGLS